jgi:hypothetical protein
VISSVENILEGEDGAIDFMNESLFEKNLVVLLFIMATFFTQITMLNMLIAVMGNVFDEVEEIKELSAVKTKLNLLADMVPTITAKSS